MEDKLLSRLVQIKTELERKVLGVHKLKRTVRHESELAGREPL